MKPLKDLIYDFSPLEEKATETNLVRAASDRVSTPKRVDPVRLLMISGLRERRRIARSVASIGWHAPAAVFLTMLSIALPSLLSSAGNWGVEAPVRTYLALVTAISGGWLAIEVIRAFRSKYLEYGLLREASLARDDLWHLWSDLEAYQGGRMSAELIVSGISATLEAVQTWLQLRDRKKAAAAFSRASTQSKAFEHNVEQLVSLVPPDVLELMDKRVRRCWVRYSEVLVDEDSFLPPEVDDATDAVKRCVCRELQRIRSLNGEVLPPGILSDWWAAYCAGSKASVQASSLRAGA